MAARAITFNLLEGFSVDLWNELHNLNSDVLSMRISSNAITLDSSTSATITEVTGNNYTAGGILCDHSMDVSGNINIAQSIIDFLWDEDAAGFTDGYTAYIFNNTAGLVIARADIRDGATLVSSAAQSVDINIENGTDLFTFTTA